MSMHRMAKALVAGAALAGWTMMAPAFAQTPHHIRGTLESVQDHMLSVKTASGGTQSVKLADDAHVFMVSPADFSSIKDGRFVGITSVEEGGKRVAKEVHVFAEKLRGLGEGHYPWDLESGPNMMTNANIATVKSVGNGRELKLDYKGGTQTITVPEGAEIVAFDPSTPDQLKAGEKVFVIAKKQADGSEVAGGVVIGKDGLKPPM